MSIIYDSERKIFYLHSLSSSYIFGFMGRHLVHFYWGKTLLCMPDINIAVPLIKRSQAANDSEPPCYQGDILPMEYPLYGHQDLRTPAFHASYYDGSTVSEFNYKSHEIMKGKPSLDGLPFLRGEKDECETLILKLSDSKTGVELHLIYSVYENIDVITRGCMVYNGGSDAMSIERIMSASIDINSRDFDVISLRGAHLRERHIQKMPLCYGSQVFESKRGSSSHEMNPFIALASLNATETDGEVFAMNFVYSGSFEAGVQVNPYDTSRMYMGINSLNFSWLLEPGEKITSPETVLVYSAHGFGQMSAVFHKIYRENLSRSKFALKPRPVLINNWESTYFDFDEDKIVNIAKKASEIGVELMVLDDGWFGKRNDDHSSLGDWVVNRDKLPGGLSSLASKIEKLGMKFGIWVEPEMVSPDSDLYRAHPDWCIHTVGRSRSEGRYQLVLDLANGDVCDYIISSLSDLFSSASISYVKWDMNRNMTEVGSLSLPKERQKETAHRYILGLYKILDALTKRFPDILFENCASGGGRFDPGMLFYMPQTWTSDNSDAADRVRIQYGTSFVYPCLSMGAHVSAVPNHQIYRTTPFKTRCEVAVCGQFGFELDLSKISSDELETAKNAIITYKLIRHTVHFGQMYRLMSPFDTNNSILQFVSPDGRQVVLCIYNILAEANGPFRHIKLLGLCDNSMYEDRRHNIKMSGQMLMNFGIPFKNIKDFDSEIYVFEKTDDIIKY